MIMDYLGLIGAGFFAAFLFIVIFGRVLSKLNIFVTGGVSTIGGLAVVISFLCIGSFYFYTHRLISSPVLGIMLSSVFMFVFGAIDDKNELTIREKFLSQVFAVSLLMFFGVRTQIVYIGVFPNVLVTFLWVLGITNAVNHLDILDGLAGSVSLLVGLSLALIAILNNDLSTALLLLPLCGALLAFLIFNFPPAKVYMGNAGSHFLGFLLAAVALAISYAPMERKIALLTPIFILGFPIFDTGFLIVMRLMKKKSIFRKSNDHLTLRFLKIGCSKERALFYMFLLCIVFSVVGVVLSQIPNRIGILLVIGVGLLCSSVLVFMGKVCIDG
jgi:UDP-GlcNAc:undecaprenyl-phosphate GlcNAc-1-phosphate transferase